MSASRWNRSDIVMVELPEDNGAPLRRRWNELVRREYPHLPAPLKPYVLRRQVARVRAALLPEPEILCLHYMDLFGKSLTSNFTVSGKIRIQL